MSDKEEQEQTPTEPEVPQKTERTEKTEKVLLAILSGKWLGFEIENIIEVLEKTEIYPVPMVPSCIKGIINLRGEIVTAIDLRKIANFEAHSSTQEKFRIVVAKKDDTRLGLIVDDVEEVSAFDITLFSESSIHSKQHDECDIWGRVIERENQTINIIDLDKIRDFLNTLDYP